MSAVHNQFKHRNTDLCTPDTVEDTEKCEIMDIRQFYAKTDKPTRPEKRPLTEEEKEEEQELATTAR